MSVGDTFIAVSMEQARSLIVLTGAGRHPLALSIVAARRLAFMLVLQGSLHFQGSSPDLVSGLEQTQNFRGQAAPAWALPALAPRRSRVCLPSPCPSSSALPLCQRVADKGGQELEGAPEL